MRRSLLLALLVLVFALAAPVAAQDHSAPADSNGASPGEILPHPCYENTLCLHYSGSEGGPPPGLFPHRLYITIDDSSGRVRTPTEYFPRWYTWVGTHRYPTMVPKIVEGSGDLRSAAWYSDGTVERPGQHPAYEYKYFVSVSQHNAVFWDVTRQEFLSRKPSLSPFGPDVIITACAEVSHDGNRSHYADYSPWMVQEFRDYLTWRGLYDAKTGKFPGWPGGDGFADDPSPDKAKGKNDPFNKVFGTSFTTWKLRYWDPEDFPDKLPLDAKPMPAAGEKGCIDGGFDPPRLPGESAFQKAWQWSDDHAPGFLELAVARCVDGVLGIINQDCGVDRTRIVSHQWSLLGNSALLWERNGEKWQQGYRSRPSWTAITRHARTGLSGVGSVRENDMLHDMDRWTTEWSIAEFYMHARERDQHSREGYINLAARLIDYPVHQTNGIWDGVRNKEYGTNSMPGEDALFWLFDAYPDRPFYLDHTPPYVPPPVRDVHITGGSQLSWSATIWSDRQAAWDEWQDFSQFEYGWQSGAGAAVTQLATTVHNNAVVGAVDGPGQWVVRAVSKAGKHGEWTAASAGAIQPPRARNLPPGLDSAAATIANKNATPVERRTALRMLALHTGELPPAAMQVLNDRADDINVRIAALGALQRVKAEGLAAALAAIVANPADDVKLRRDAAGTLGRIGATDQVELLIDRLAAADEDPRVRLYAARSIGMLAPDHRKFGAGLASLIEWGFAQPSSVEAEVVNEISCAIAAAHNVEATVPALIAAIEAPANQWKTVRKSQAAEALGALARAGNRAAQTALIDLAKKPASDYPDVFVRGRIVGQAARLEKGDAQALKQLKDEAEPPVIRWEAARGLRMADRKPGRQTLPLMRKLLTDTSAAHGLRFEAARMLAAWGERGDVSALAGVLKNGDEWPELRELCARSLGDMAQRDVDSAGCVKALLAGLDSPQCDRGIRYFVGDALNRALGLGLPLGDGAPFDAAKAVWMKGRAR